VSPRPALAAALLAAACASVPREYREPWAADWNRRLEAAPTPFEHPCATLEFSAWADAFLASCAPYGSRQQGECVYRQRWVRARSNQCQEWVAYLLRNHNQQVRDDTTPEPSMRVD
jgi:hypothetical protein